jgi:hypothetical protein
MDASFLLFLARMFISATMERIKYTVGTIKTTPSVFILLTLGQIF